MMMMTESEREDEEIAAFQAEMDTGISSGPMGMGAMAGREKRSRVSDYVMFGAQSVNLREAIVHLKENNAFPFTNPDAGTEFDDRFFAPAEPGSAFNLDLPPETQHTAQRLCVLLYRKNVRAYRTVELIKSFALGDGMKVRAVDPDVQAILDMHWKANRWQRKNPERLRALGVFGEQLYPVAVDEQTSLVTLTSVSPLRVRRVLRSREDGERLERVVSTLASAKTGNTPESVGFRIIDHDPSTGGSALSEDMVGPGERPTAAFFFAVNRIGGASRGIPDMLASVDWLEGLDGFLWSLLERAHVAEEIVHDLEVTGADNTEVRKFVNQFKRALKGGGIYAHNEKVKHKITAPNIGAFEADSVAGLFLRQIQSGTGLAGLFYGDSADLTRAAAGELTVPVAKMIQDRQNFWRDSIRQVLDYQLEWSQRLGKLPRDADLTYDIDMPRVLIRDMTTITKALGELGTSLEMAVDNGWLDNVEAGRTYRAAAAELGNFVGDPPPRRPTEEDDTDPRLVDQIDGARESA